MKIETLVDDIYTLMREGGDLSDETVQGFADSLSTIVRQRLDPEARKQESRGLRMSNLGEHCDRKAWYGAHKPDAGEPLEPHVLLKFLLGDVWEAVLLFLARASGHEVVGEQDSMDLHGVPGHRDAVIDGVTVDVKSASTYSFKKFAQPGVLTKDEDSFFYLDQLGGYVEAGRKDPLVTDKIRGAFLVGDKTLGHICLDIKEFPENRDWKTKIKHKQQMLASDALPERGYPDVPDGKSGNMKLGTACSYCAFKHKCWQPRTFLYSNGPRYLTKVARTPDVPEVT